MINRFPGDIMIMISSDLLIFFLCCFYADMVVIPRVGSASLFLPSHHETLAHMGLKGLSGTIITKTRCTNPPHALPLISWVPSSFNTTIMTPDASACIWRMNLLRREVRL
jgi:hypothetical protein